MGEPESSSDPCAPVLTLPAAVRGTILTWAAEALGQLPAAQIPAALVRVARFTPAKRARLGAIALAQAVDADPGFHAAVAERARSVSEANGDRAVAVAAAAHLLRLPTAAALVAALPESGAGDDRVEPDEWRREQGRLQRRLAEVTAERDEAIRSAGLPGSNAAELEKLRRRLREQGTRLRAAEETVAAAALRSSEELGSLRREVHRLTSEVNSWQERARLAAQRADRAQEGLGRVREQTGVRRATADRRLDLLLSTVEGAVSGLRREWNLAGGGLDPADVVAEGIPGVGVARQSTDDPSRLSSWLSLPAAHLIVDGYNVSKTGYPDLTLAQQRDRLVRLLSALGSRTSAEVTVVFDGAAVAVPAPPGRGVRVLFSPPGVIADEVIRDLVAAEPIGRVVIVVSSDREVADGVQHRGARTAGSPVLLSLIS